MVLTLDKVAKEVASRCGDHNGERLKDIRRYINDIVIDLSMVMRKGSVYQTATLTVTSGQATLPDHCAAVLKVYDTGSIFYESIGNDTYRSREQNSSIAPSMKVTEDVPNWTITLLNYSATSGTIMVDYLIAKDDPAMMPAYYKSLIVTGALSLYHLDRSTIEKYREYDSKYREMKNMFKEIQSYNTGETSEMKPLGQLESEDPSNSSSTSNAYINAGGY